MRTLIALFLFTGLAILPCSAQLNQYKYFIVPKRFDIFKEANQYQSSTLVKFLLTKYGYDAVYDDAMPEDLFWNRCRGVTVQLDENSSFLQTKVAIVFRDCNGREVFRTLEGSSKSKVYKDAYAECIQEAMDDLAVMKYEYTGPDEVTEPLPETPTQPLVEKEVEALVPASNEAGLLVSSETEEVVARAEESTQTVQPEIIEAPILWSEAVNENGYILSHPENETTWVLMRTSDPLVYLAYSQNKQGIAFKQDTGWKLEYYLGEEREELKVHTRDQ